MIFSPRRRAGGLRLRGEAALVATIMLGLFTASTAFGQRLIPHLRTQGSATQLVVDTEPFLVLGGELGNSSASSTAYMRPIWPKLVELNLNTLLAPVYWDLVEPEEGRYDFALVDSLVDGARRHGLRLVLLWFGSWKNSMSSYAPAWVKTDPDRFPRAEQRDGRALEILTPFSAENREADARAFTAFMRHLRLVDGEHHTVIMVQVENEIGMIPEARDHSDNADRHFVEAVPNDLTDYLEQNREALVPELRRILEGTEIHGGGSWEDVFGEGLHTDELFMAWHFARYVEHLAAAGKSEYALPMFVNAALIRPGYEPGRYPSGGPLPHLLDVWRAGAPSIDFLAPDIYFPNFVEWAARYHQSGNPLFIPEAGRAGDPLAAAQVLYAVAEHDAIGFSPFSIESIEDPGSDPLARGYDLLAQLAPVILEHQGMGTITGVLPVVAYDGTVNDEPLDILAGGYVLHVSFHDPWMPDAGLPSGGLIISLGPDEFLVAGTGLVLTFDTPEEDDSNAGILSIQAGRFESGRWIGGRWLNGDQSHQGRHLRIPPGQYEIQHLRLYRY